MKILLVEDNIDILQVLEVELKDEGYLVDTCGDGGEALYKMMNWEYDAVILDIMLPGMEGRDVLAQFRKTNKKTPILMLTAQSNVTTKVNSFDLGADDYVTKPFEYLELSARLRALLRRREQKQQQVVSVGTVSIHLDSKQVDVVGKAVELTRQEYAVLSALAIRQGRSVKREFLYDFLSESEGTVTANLLDVIISKLRNKLGKELILTQRGVGYIIPE